MKEGAGMESPTTEEENRQAGESPPFCVREGEYMY